MNKIFISYSHKDEEWKDRLVTHLSVLEMEDLCTLWDDSKIEKGDDWLPEIEKALNEAQIVIMLISADFLKSNFIRKIEVPKALERRQKQGVWVIPFIVRACAWEEVQWVEPKQLTPRHGKPLSTFEDPEIDVELANLVKEIASRIKMTKTKDKNDSKIPFTPLPPENISISKLPTTGKELFGREKELAFLDNAWADEHTHVVILAAWGGVGKTALIKHWLNLMEQKNYLGAKRVYGWSFYNQGAEEGEQASAEPFLQESLQWFGHPNPEEGSLVEKGRRLARLVREERTLLILDSLEPLQYPPGQVYEFDGNLKDRGMRAFLKELAGGHPGLCVITTREKVEDLEDNKKSTVKEKKLEHLSEVAGAQLLKSLGVNDSEKDILQAVNEYAGHALALTLLGTYIKIVCNGDIRKRDTIPQLTKEKKRGPHAQRMMEAYEQWLKDSVEKKILYIMGLFDRPAEEGAIEALKADPPIPDVTEPLQLLSEVDWKYALSYLRDANLLAGENPQKPGTLDCHPLVREHFGQKFREQNPGGWKEAHKRLYHYFEDLPVKDLPDTLQEMEPLFAAVAHGCKAGLHHEVLNNVYWKRISRGHESFIFQKLGAFGASLAMLTHFFDVPWSHPAAGLPEKEKAAVLNTASFALKTLGRQQEAIPPQKKALEMHIKQKNWLEAAKDAHNFSELMLTQGKVSQAKEYARQCVTYADSSGNGLWRVISRTIFADTLHQAGQFQEAEKWFREAETMQKMYQPQYYYLYWLQGFRYCNLLLGTGKYKEVIERASKTLEWVKSEVNLILAVALDNLSLGRAWMAQTIQEGSGNFHQAMDYLNSAVENLREYGSQEHLPLGLLARAECYRLQKQFPNARDDLNEMLEIAKPGAMKLFLIDYHLEAGRLCEAEGREEEAEKHFQKAGQLTEETGFYRKKK